MGKGEERRALTLSLSSPLPSTSPSRYRLEKPGMVPGCALDGAFSVARARNICTRVTAPCILVARERKRARVREKFNPHRARAVRRVAPVEILAETISLPRSRPSGSAASSPLDAFPYLVVELRASERYVRLTLDALNGKPRTASEGNSPSHIAGAYRSL